MEFFKLERDFVPVGSDYVYDKMDDFLKILPYLYPKVEGTWKITLVDMRVEDCRKLVDERLVPDYVNLEVHLKTDVLGMIWAEYPKLRQETKSKWQIYMEIISNYPRLIQRRASSEIFKRCNGNAEEIRDALETLLNITEPDDEITIKHVNSILLANDTVYSRDVVFSLLLKNNPLVPSRGHRLSKYKTFSNYMDLYIKLENTIGRGPAFYAIRKTLKKLYESKLEYLKNQTVKDADLMEVVDVYALAHAYMCFYLADNPDQVIACLFLIEERTKDASSFQSTILAHYS